ncbi:hypothetical protein FB451DRAFT_1190319 [Mycena latifolia]|nr:hypothetical protein FB451DRAFT_1190319 [Mycena latifolia]
MSSNMVSSIPGSLSKADEAIVRKLFKVIRATKYDDPVDQDAFLVESATTVLKYRPQVASFALIPELSECVFNIRSMMHANNARLGTPASDIFVSIQDFAGEIIRKRHTFRERRRANTERMRVAEGMAARVERSVALEYASKVNNKSPISPGDDTVSIPSSSDESGAEEPPRTPKNPPASLIKVESANTQPSSQVRIAVLLSPLSELGVRLGRLSLEASPHNPPSFLLSPSPSLPDLVPDFTLSQHQVPVKGSGWKRSRTIIRKPRNFLTHAPVVQCNSLRLVPRPYGPPPVSPKTNFVDDWLLSKPRFADFPRPRKNYSGSSKPSANPNRLIRRPPHKKVKRCYYCTAADHLVALCPLREPID